MYSFKTSFLSKCKTWIFRKPLFCSFCSFWILHHVHLHWFLILMLTCLLNWNIEGFHTQIHEWNVITLIVEHSHLRPNNNLYGEFSHLISIFCNIYRLIFFLDLYKRKEIKHIFIPNSVHDIPMKHLMKVETHACSHTQLRIETTCSLRGSSAHMGQPLTSFKITN